MVQHGTFGVADIKNNATHVLTADGLMLGVAHSSLMTGG
jgi:hypothetical protein